jgi:hypothetical protein
MTRPLVPAVQSVQSDEALEALSEYLPADCRDVLYGLAAGMTLDDALTEMLGATQQEVAAMVPTSGGDFTKLAQTPNFDLVLVEGQDELKRILEGSLEEWRIFLHPYQHKLVRWETKGAMNITGAAGTGKTVALMHRAVHLAGRLSDPKSRILLTTFTTNLSITIKHLIEGLSPGCADKIEVTNLHALARTICSRSGWKGRIGDDEELDQVWEEVWLDPSLGELPMDKAELRREYELVIDPNVCTPRVLTIGKLEQVLRSDPQLLSQEALRSFRRIAGPDEFGGALECP